MAGSIHLKDAAATRRGPKPRAVSKRLCASMHTVDGSGSVTIYADGPGDKVRERARVSLLRDDWKPLRDFINDQLPSEG
jgi:hypothetical protein